MSICGFCHMLLCYVNVSVMWGLIQTKFVTTVFLFFRIGNVLGRLVLWHVASSTICSQTIFFLCLQAFTITLAGNLAILLFACRSSLGFVFFLSMYLALTLIFTATLQFIGMKYEKYERSLEQFIYRRFWSRRRLYFNCVLPYGWERSIKRQVAGILFCI